LHRIIRLGEDEWGKLGKTLCSVTVWYRENAYRLNFKKFKPVQFINRCRVFNLAPHPEKRSMRNSHFVPARHVSAVALAVSALIGAPAQAFQFTSESGEVKGAFDTNITYGAMWRVDHRDPQLVGLGNGGLRLR
jgi:hypothetical protein